jgi:thiopeptide-type bacteriocin biosynthesis protein
MRGVPTMRASLDLESGREPGREPSRLAVPTDLLDATVPLGAKTARLADILRFCLDGDPGHLSVGTCRQALAEQCMTFLSGGLDAVRRPADVNRWVEVLLVLPDGDPGPSLYAELKELVCQVEEAGELADFHFIHQSPGLRLRFHAFGANHAALYAELQSRLSDWQYGNLTPQVRYSLYEPATALFGGSLSMAFVHRLFTLDSRAWLAVHAGERADEMDSVWAISIGMLSALLGALGIRRDDTEVWGRVSSQVARARGGESIRTTISDRETADFAADASAVWSRPEWIDAVLSPGARAIVRQFSIRAADLVQNWGDAYFNTPQAVVGPMEVAALLAVRHWNRARAPLDLQLVFARTLASGRAP